MRAKNCSMPFCNDDDCFLCNYNHDFDEENDDEPP